MNVWVQGSTGVIQDGASVQEWWTALNKHRKKLLQHVAVFLLSFVYSMCIIKSLAKKTNEHRNNQINDPLKSLNLSHVIFFRFEIPQPISCYSFPLK